MLGKREDSFLHQGLRKKLVEQLRQPKLDTKGRKVGDAITDEKVLDAIAAIPRHWFFGLNTVFHDKDAYEDKAFPIGAGQTISQPYTVAFQSQLLDIKKGDRVLEIGTGSGYQAAVLSKMGAEVYTIERQRNLFEQTQPFLFEIGFRKIMCYYGDGYAGLPAFAPFDKIIITAAVSEWPENLLKQLKIGGMLVMPEQENKDSCTMKRYTKLADGTLQEEKFGAFSFVPMLKGTANGI